jgi:hypothetical protein
MASSGDESEGDRLPIVECQSERVMARHTMLSWLAYLILTPSTSTPGRSSLPVLGDSIIVTIHDIASRRIADGSGGHLHGRRHDDDICISRDEVVLKSGFPYAVMTRRCVPRIENAPDGVEYIRYLAGLAALKKICRLSCS